MKNLKSYKGQISDFTVASINSTMADDNNIIDFSKQSDFVVSAADVIRILIKGKYSELTI